MATVFGDKVREFREKAGKSQGDLARHLGVSVAYISDVERGHRAPFAPDRHAAIARFLDMPISVLVDARAEFDGFYRLPVCGTPEHDRTASFLASVWKDMPAYQVQEIENTYACHCDGCTAIPPRECYSCPEPT